jgi:hypothetical protein
MTWVAFWYLLAAVCAGVGIGVPNGRLLAAAILFLTLALALESPLVGAAMPS